MSSTQTGFNCICGSSYATEAGLKQHQRRYCKGRPPGNGDSICPICNNSFNGFRGMRQHMRHQHPEAYNADLEAESRNARAAWTEDEENALAKAEAAYEGEDIYSFLLTVSRRSKDALKGRRRMASYKEKVQRFRESMVPTVPPEAEETAPDEVLRMESALREHITNIPHENLSEADETFRTLLLEQRNDAGCTALNNWCEQLLMNNGRRPRENANRQPNPRDNIVRELQQPGLRSKKRRRLEYRLAQQDYTHDQKALADRILDDRSNVMQGTTPTDEELFNACVNIFTTPSREDEEPVNLVLPEMQEISYPISNDDIIAAINNIKSNAAGSDGLTLKDIKKMPVNRLSLLFNSILLLDHMPACLKRGRTIFIPKKDNDLQLVSNWRPLTIPSVICRILHRILANRLGSIELNSCQRGFTKIDGCFANYATIETLIKMKRKKGQPLCLVFLDLSKAFDTVSHQSIQRALKRLNIDPKTRNLIRNSYEGCTTSAQCGSHHIGTFEVKRGVKQGDPHSPFLFNAVIDELLYDLQQKEGIPVGTECRINALAYADDIVLAATNVGDAQRMLDEAVDFFHKRGLAINVGKCSSLVLRTVPSKKKVYVATEPTLKVGDESVPTTNIGSAFSYLGQTFTTSGLTTCTAENLQNQLTAIRRAALKPQQKLCLITKYLVPRYIASLQRPNINLKILKDVDKKIRATTRKILSVFQHSSNAIIHTPTKLGGLGVFNFTFNIPLMILNRWEKIRSCSPLLENTYQLSSAWVNRLRQLVPSNIATKDDVKNMLARKLQDSYSGGIADVENHLACRAFIRDPPKYWSGGDFVKAIQLRYNLLPCRSIPSNPVEERRCRAGCHRNESLSHILQRCPLTHRQRILRHDYIVHRVKTAALKRNWLVDIEPHIRSADGILKKPDLVMRKGNRVVICDVGVHWEGDNELETYFQHKVATYSTPSFTERMQQMHPDSNIMVFPLILGARGTWCSLNAALERELDLQFREVQDIITTTLRGGWQTHQAFMRAVWRSFNA